VRIHALLYLSHVEYDEGRMAQARSHAEESVTVARRTDDTWTLAYALNVLGRAARELHDYSQAREYLEQSLALFRGTGDPVNCAIPMSNLGELARMTGDLTAARSWIEASLEVRRQAGEPYTLMMDLYHLGLVVMEKDSRRAAALFTEALHLAQQHGQNLYLACILTKLGELALRSESFSDAEQFLARSLAISTNLGLVEWISESLALLSVTAHGQGRLSRAACIRGAVTALREANGVHPTSVAHEMHLSRLAAIRRDMDEEAFAAAWAAGQAMTLDEAVALVLDAESDAADQRDAK
jgi:tetratricopeptide (TPR) repeat protein